MSSERLHRIRVVYEAAVDTPAASTGGAGYLFLLTLIKTPVRQRWLVAYLFIVLLVLFLSPGYAGPLVRCGRPTGTGGSGAAIAHTRFGLLAAAFAQTTLRSFPLTTDLSAWYAP